MSNRTSPLRVGIVGCGNISRNHLEAFGAIDGVELAGVCDVDAAKARDTAERWGIDAGVGSVQRLLALDLDIISVCTPHPTHEEVVLQAASAGVHVLCEKPIAVDVASAQRMVDACDAAGVEFSVLFQRRFWPAARQLRTLIDDGTLGAPMLGQVSVLLHRDHDYYAADSWRGTWATDGGGVLMTQAIHYLDLLQWYMGPVAEVYGVINTFKHGEHIEVEDSAAALLKFTSGAMATVTASTAADPALGVQLRLTGATGASAELSEFPEGSDGRLTLLAAGPRVQSEPVHPAGVEANAALSAINGALVPHHAAQIAQFVAAVRGEPATTVSGTDATTALRILLAIYASARSGVPVRFNRFPADVPAASDEVLARLERRQPAG